jgi:hypothetical protein
MIVGLMLGVALAVSVEAVRRNAERTNDGEAAALFTVEWGSRAGLPLTLVAMPVLERAHGLLVKLPFPATYVALLLVVVLNWLLLSSAVAYAISRWRRRKSDAVNPS